MKILATLTLLTISLITISATEQYPDKLLYNNLTLSLSTGWGHPSPLETYFYQNRIKYPFSMLSTANYRGHIATWVIENSRFYLKEIDISGKRHSPAEFAIGGQNKTQHTEPVFADWFSGMIECHRAVTRGRGKSGSFYFQVRNGEVISMSEISNQDVDKINRLSGTVADEELMKKYKLLFLNSNYISYYYRLNNNDAIQFRGRQCQLNTDLSHLSPIYRLYGNKHLNWPFNWENLERSGAPNCSWVVQNDSLFLRGVVLFSGLRFDSIDKEKLDLRELFPDKVVNGQVFADWVSGVQLIIYGTDSTHSFGYKEFKPKEFTYCRLEKGILKEAFSLPNDFNLAKQRDSLDARLKALTDDY